ncbi:Hypothetical protein A7982_11990 [Minicystis rosea]|nr:Hypothetical protein A7982_11990 [Minicystis rosea]
MTTLLSIARRAAMGAVIAIGATGCVEAAVYERTAAQLEATTRAAEQKDRQIRALSWQVAALSQQLREGQARSEAAQSELAAQVRELAAANAAQRDRLKAKEEESARPPLPFPGDDGARTPEARRRNEEMRRLSAALDAQNARLLERLTRLEQKLDARPDDRRKPPAPAQPERTVSTEIIDPWGFNVWK